MCPSEIRNLTAVAHNIVTRMSDPARRAEMMWQCGWITELRDAVQKVQPLVDKHFDDPLHSHGYDDGRDRLALALQERFE